MPRKKTKQKNSKKSTGIVKISNLAPKSFLSNAFSNYKKNTIMLYCQSGNRSEQALEILKTLGYKKVINLGGLLEARELLGEEIVKS